MVLVVVGWGGRHIPCLLSGCNKSNHSSNPSNSERRKPCSNLWRLPFDKMAPLWRCAVAPCWWCAAAAAAALPTPLTCCYG